MAGPRSRSARASGSTLDRSLIVIDDLTHYTGLGDEQIQWIRDEQVVVYPGRDPAKPVLRWAGTNTLGKHPGALAPGSGVSPGHVDSVNGKRGAIKNTNEYMALAQRILDSDDGGGFEKVLEATIRAATGSKGTEEFDCEECGHHNVVEIRRAPDPRAQKVLIETILGKPVQRAEVDMTLKSLQVTLSELIDIDPSELIRPGLTPEQVAERQRYVEERAD